MRVGIDFGTTNTDAVCLAGTHDSHSTVLHRWTLPALPMPDESSIEMVLEAGDLFSRINRDGLALIALTGGNRSRIPPTFHERCPIVQVSEIEAIGRGGLMLSGYERAIVVSAGSGTAVVKAEMDTFDNDTNGADKSFRATHVTGTGIGGGTLMGLGRLLLHVSKPQLIDELAQRGSANAVNLTIGDVLGGALGRIPADATAVNFGRVARSSTNNGEEFRLEDIASALVELVSQTIAVVGINAARANEIDHIVITGHLTDMHSIHGIFQRIAEFSGITIHIPQHGGFAVAAGSVLAAQEIIGAELLHEESTSWT